jgi:hypothetical protein
MGIPALAIDMTERSKAETAAGKLFRLRCDRVCGVAFGRYLGRPR